ncbi:MAG TPA: pyridoxamine 5'-phosphate oxidase family protein [Chloroflexota bacterium]|nr:pyridoxamine 5'-phosphate oxidase family protein [Chloroflexota bacterium]
MENTDEARLGKRLKMPKHYQAAKGDEIISWSSVADKLAQARNYWLATTNPDGRPHVTPVWGAWVADIFYFDGIFTARWARNLASNPAASIHLESGDEVVIVEGKVDDVAADQDLAARIIAEWQEKYGRLLPEPTGGMYRLIPRVARAWSRFPDDATRWEFEVSR